MSFRTNTSILVFAVTLALHGCVSAPPSPTGTQAPATATDTRQQLDALFENYFEDNLRANPVLATYIGDHRYDEQLRAMRLVVDTGLHAKGWTREQAIRFMLDNSTMAESDVVSEVERYIARPGQALGPKFDLRDFHREVLSDGAVPMDTLEAKVDRWIAARR